MRVAISGASGFVGRLLVPCLLAHGVDLLLIGRDPAGLGKLFPTCPSIGYSEIVAKAGGCDLFLHLAAVNSGADADPGTYELVNAGLALSTYRSAREAGIGRFVYVSSVHALDPANVSNYARSKRAAAEALSGQDDWNDRILYLPAVVGERFAGRLGVLNSLPKSARAWVLGLLAAVRPVVHVEKLAAYVREGAPGWTDEDSAMILSDDQDANLWYRLIKRLLDLSAALVFVLCFFWLLIAIALAVRLDSPGPAVFRQKRVGRHGRVFTCLKFRTMGVTTPELASHQVSASAVTRVGAFLRRTKLDELPQLFNVLFNQMSLVGPRPCLVTQTELIAERKLRSILYLKPGITGLAQVNGIDMSAPRRVAEWDRRYLDLRTITFDLRILVATVMGHGSGDRTAS